MLLLNLTVLSSVQAPIAGGRLRFGADLVYAPPRARDPEAPFQGQNNIRILATMLYLEAR